MTKADVLIPIATCNGVINQIEISSHLSGLHLSILGDAGNVTELLFSHLATELDNGELRRTLRDERNGLFTIFNC